MWVSINLAKRVGVKAVVITLVNKFIYSAEDVGCWRLRPNMCWYVGIEINMRR